MNKGMKQHLTVEQLDKLARDEYKNFIKLIESKCPYECMELSGSALAEWLTIGKLIELLDEEKPHIYPELIWDGNQYRYTDKWVVEIDSMTKNKPMDFTQNKLIDALFEALCYVLGGE